MSVTCDKSISINVNSVAIHPDAYWTLDEVGIFVDRVDMVHGVHAQNTGLSAGLASTPGLFSNGLAYIETGALSIINTAPNDANLAISSSNGWSICFWFKMLAFAPYGLEPTFKYDGRFGTKSSEVFVAFDMFAPNAVTFNIRDNNLNGFFPANFSPTIGAWTFLHVFFDPVLTQVGYQINAGARVLDPTPGAAYAASTGGSVNWFQNWGGAPSATQSVIVDELLLKLSRILTQAEVSFLWNSGNGRTWPIT